MLKQGYRVILENLQENPQCSHGPTLIFQRLVDGQPQSRKFYACSACRDRKNCSFFLWTDEKMSRAARNAWQEERKKIQPGINIKTLHTRFLEIMSQKKQKKKLENVHFCHSCTSFIKTSVVNKEHKGHNIQGNIKLEQLWSPTNLIRPLQETSKEAQFFFSESALKFLNSTLVALNATTVISIGTPRLAEHLLNAKFAAEILLMDIDWRFGVFFGKRFCWYNMFNHHFLSTEIGETNYSEYQKTLRSAANGSSIVAVMDPPFGGRVEALAHTLRCLEKDIAALGKCTNFYFLWVYPYFMEAYIKTEIPESHMLDYKINYTNHPEYNQDSKQGKKLGSPVRVFTNAPPALISMPVEEGYRFCEKCHRFVAQENKHCDLCKACTSKDGRTYIHCNACKRCVKPTWKHCNKCSRCCLLKHKCISPHKITTTQQNISFLIQMKQTKKRIYNGKVSKLQSFKSRKKFTANSSRKKCARKQ